MADTATVGTTPITHRSLRHLRMALGLHQASGSQDTLVIAVRAILAEASGSAVEQAPTSDMCIYCQVGMHETDRCQVGSCACEPCHPSQP
jgi:hypothetical protein